MPIAILFFGFDDRLWRIAIHGRSHSGDGTGVSYHHRHPYTLDHPDRLMASVHLGQSWRFTEYQTETEHIQLGIRAQNVVAGYHAIYIKSLALEVEVAAGGGANGRDENRYFCSKFRI
jgi:hypothetical protein